MCKAYRSKSATHQVTFQPTARDGQRPTFPKCAPSKHPHPSSFSGAAVTHRCGWGPHHRDAFHGRRHEPSFTNWQGLER
jgi:hypothetical protein